MGFVAIYFDEFVMFCVGLWATAAGFGLVATQSPDPGRHNALMASMVPHFKWLGPMLIIIAIILAITATR